MPRHACEQLQLMDRWINALARPVDAVMHGLKGEVWMRYGSNYDEDQVATTNNQWLNVTWSFNRDRRSRSTVARFNSTDNDGAGTYNMSNSVNVPSNIDAQELIDCAPSRLISNIVGCHARSVIIAQYDIQSSINKIDDVSRSALLRLLIKYDVSDHALLIGSAMLLTNRYMITPMHICKLDECIKDGALDEGFLFERTLASFKKFKDAEVTEWLDTA